MKIAFINQFLGNKSNPNALTIQLISDIVNRTGSVALHPGRTSVDSSIFDPTLTGSQIFDPSPARDVHRTTYGPSFFDTINLNPPSTKVNLDLNLLNNWYEIAFNQAAAAVQYLGSRLDAREIGNEPDLMSPMAIRTRQVLKFTPRHGFSRTSLWGLTFLPTRRIQYVSPYRFHRAVYAFDDLVHEPIIVNFTTVNIIANGINNTSTVKTYSQHTSPYY
ncbi:glycoside hydrolase family 79 protein [Laccaria amethystina LaAM-08-1]|uniref:Glycoside hydrolase family 79 protein n=1 Tax=Laccaria amethystina LaAM-08-1 TaxID=1095629 RepID=A0A0C9X1T7_9AGAR|nr:glycoside hydrolase family 79 protein [Laccaria amethystina LaAM-08-1]